MIGEMGVVRVPIVECTTLLASGRVGAVVVTTDWEENERPSLEAGVCVECTACDVSVLRRHKIIFRKGI
jgi:hypothetical protein